MIRAVVFDFGGVVDKDTDILTFEYIAGRFGIDYNLAVSNIREFLPDYQTGKISDKEFWQRFSQNVGKELPSDYGILWTEVHSRESRKDPEITEIIRKLRSNSYKVACLSNTIPPHGDYNRSRNNFDGFDVVVLSYEVGLRKPDMKIYRLTARKLGVGLGDCAWIDDNARNLENLPNAIHYQNPEQLELELRQLGVKL